MPAVRRPERKAGRTNFTGAQLQAMELVFQQFHYPDVSVLTTLAHRLTIPVEKICTWFQNRRSKYRKSSKSGHVNWMREKLFNHEGAPPGTTRANETTTLKAGTTGNRKWTGLKPSTTKMCADDITPSARVDHYGTQTGQPAQDQLPNGDSSYPPEAAYWEGYQSNLATSQNGSNSYHTASENVSTSPGSYYYETYQGSTDHYPQHDWVGSESTTVTDFGQFDLSAAARICQSWTQYGFGTDVNYDNVTATNVPTSTSPGDDANVCLNNTLVQNSVHFTPEGDGHTTHAHTPGNMISACSYETHPRHLFHQTSYVQDGITQFT